MCSSSLSDLILLFLGLVREQLTATQLASIARNRQSLNTCIQEARRTSLLGGNAGAGEFENGEV
jgi:hypothetical protein